MSWWSPRQCAVDEQRKHRRWISRSAVDGMRQPAHRLREPGGLTDAGSNILLWASADGIAQQR